MAFMNKICPGFPTDFAAPPNSLQYLDGGGLSDQCLLAGCCPTCASETGVREIPGGALESGGSPLGQESHRNGE